MAAFFPIGVQFQCGLYMENNEWKNQDQLARLSVRRKRGIGFAAVAFAPHLLDMMMRVMSAMGKCVRVGEEQEGVLSYLYQQRWTKLSNYPPLARLILRLAVHLPSCPGVFKHILMTALFQSTVFRIAQTLGGISPESS